MARVGRVGATLLTALAFGAAVAVAKGTGADLQSGFGNLSAPWLLLAFLTGRLCRTVPRGALMGLAGTVTALAGFYATVAVLLAEQLRGGFAADLHLEITSNRVYFAGGALTGPLLGAAGARFARRSWPVLCRWLAAVLIGEGAVAAAIQGHELTVPANPISPSTVVGWYVDDWTPYLAQGAVGVAVVLASLWYRRRHRPIAAGHDPGAFGGPGGSR